MWKGNMDIEPCGSTEAIAYYICKYLAKTEPQQMLTSIAESISRIRNEESDISRHLFKMCMNISQERQVSACKCVFRLCHLPLRHSSRKCIFVNCRKPEDRYRVCRFNQANEMDGFYSNIFERYEKRPLTHDIYDFGNMSLTEFAMNFEPGYKKPADVDEDLFDVPDIIPRSRKQFITLTDGRKMVIRSRPAVVRVPYFKISDNAEQYYYSLLLQYFTYRHGSELLADYSTAKVAFLARGETLQLVDQRMQLVRKRDKQLENAFNQVHAFEILNEFIMPIHDPAEEEVEQQPPMEDTSFQNGINSRYVGQKKSLLT
ncbi:hypothetical protein QAD02_008416 [Eretmocerus hayati]|uniref:Uncharacterized protein n=1 Tax=Eretmocerus hayati TaxID=131215 RepID=A0ACC2N8T6_9HYME|nr:hypothetical protein QAD02_008416 [Eretmocerus hayati]